MPTTLDHTSYPLTETSPYRYSSTYYYTLVYHELFTLDDYSMIFHTWYTYTWV